MSGLIVCARARARRVFLELVSIFSLSKRYENSDTSYARDEISDCFTFYSLEKAQEADLIVWYGKVIKNRSGHIGQMVEIEDGLYVRMAE